MKLFTFVLPLAYAVPSMNGIKKVQKEIALGLRTDGNASLIQQMLQFYLIMSGQSTDNAAAMLNYGCWCQLLTDRVKGKGDSVDELDA